MKFLIIGDLHGQKPRIYYKGFDAIIAPGDFCSDAPRTYMFHALRERMRNPRSKVLWWDLVGKRKAGEMVKHSFRDGRTILEFLNSFNVPVFSVPGNWDWTGVDKDSQLVKKNLYHNLIKGLHNVVDVYHQRVPFDGYNIIGHGIISGPEYPQYKEDLERFTKRELQKMYIAYQRSSQKLSMFFENATQPVIFLSHNVPFNTPLDKITNKDSPKYGYHYGSLIAREMIEAYQPLVCIGGHMHEHFRSYRMGKTIAINAGFGSHVNVWLEVENNRIKKLEFHRGKN